MVFFSAFGLSRYAEVVVFDVLSLRGSLGLTIASALLQVSAPVAVLGWIRYSGKPMVRWVGPRASWAGDIASGIGIGFLLLVTSGICVAISVAIGKAILGHQPTLPDVQRGFDGWWLIPFGILLIVAAPICEELLFRGFLFRGLRVRWSWWPAALATSLMWALVHGSPYRLLNIFVDGLILAKLYERRKGLLATVAAHATLNTIIFIVLLSRLS